MKYTYLNLSDTILIRIIEWFTIIIEDIDEYAKQPDSQLLLTPHLFKKVMK